MADVPGRLPIDLAYVLTRYPIAHETFVTGEIRVVADRVRTLEIIGVARTAERDMRPGGIPDRVELGFVPHARTPAFWLGNARMAVRAPRWYAGLVGAAARPALAGNNRVRWAHRILGVPRVAERPPARRPTHLHAHFAAHGAVAARQLARLWRVPYSMTVHAYDIFQPNRCLASLVRDASVTIAISDLDRRHVLDAVPDADPERVVVIHAGVPVGELTQLGREARGDGRPSEPPTVISVGRLVEKKGMDVLIDAVGRLVDAGRDVRCEIIGDGPLRGQLTAQIRRRGLDGRVTLAGGLSPDETRRRIARASLFALACRRTPSGDMDGIPVALMEAMACGTPVISTTISAIPELIDDGRTGRLVAPDATDQLAEAIAETLDRPAGRDAWREVAQRVVERDFDQAKNALATAEAIAAAGDRSR